MLNLLRRKPTFVIDRAFGCAKTHKLKRQFESNRFATTNKALRKCHDIDHRTFLLDVLAEANNRPTHFEQWVQEEPGSALPRLLSGANALEWAWEARTFSRGDDLSDEQWAHFRLRLDLARGELERALAIDPSESAAYAYLLRCALGQEWEIEDATALYQQASNTDASPWLATYNYFVFLCQKWFGSHDLMFNFARAVSAAAPLGSDLHAIVAHAHIERWLFALAFDGDANADDYWLANDVFDELIDVYKLWVDKTESSPYERHAANAFLFCFSSLSAREVVRVELERIGPYPTYTPWRYLGDPVAVYQEIWINAGA